MTAGCHLCSKNGTAQLSTEADQRGPAGIAAPAAAGRPRTSGFADVSDDCTFCGCLINRLYSVEQLQFRIVFFNIVDSFENLKIHSSLMLIKFDACVCVYHLTRFLIYHLNV
jgi:hypothetical protein